MQICLELDEETVAYLGALAHKRNATEPERAADALSYLAHSIADGVRRPGAWERGVVYQLFGPEFEERLEPNPERRGNQRVREASR